MNNAPDSARLSSPITGTGTESKSKASGLTDVLTKPTEILRALEVADFSEFLVGILRHSWASRDI